MIAAVVQKPNVGVRASIMKNMKAHAISNMPATFIPIKDKPYNANIVSIAPKVSGK